jgi:hypothetical protein
MRNRLLTTAITVLALAAPGIAAAGDCTNLQCSGVVVDKLYVRDDGRVWIYTDADEVPLTCNATAKPYVFLDLTPDAGAAYTALLTARVLNEPVTIKLKDNVDGTNLCHVRDVIL